MTTIDTRPEHGAMTLAANSGGVLAGVTGWITTADHKRIGRLFVVDSLLTLAATLVIGGLLGFERLDADAVALDAGALAQMASLYRVALPFMVVGPLLLGLAIAVVPLQLGARGLAFGRAGALGFWSWFFGSALVLVAFIGNGGPGGGDAKMVELFLAGLGLALLGLMIAAGALATTVLTSRAPGMTLRRVPAFAWASLVGSVVTLLTLPVLLGDLILLTVDHRSARTPGFGGNQDLLTWMGWSLTQPATLVLLVPALGIAADVVATASGRRMPMRGVLFTGVGLFSTAVLSAVTQKVHTLPWEGDFFAGFGDKIADLVPYALFNLLFILGPVVVLGVCVLALAGGKPRLASPAAFLFEVVGLGLLALGAAAHALTGIVDLQLVGTTYEEGVLLLALGGAVLCALGGVAHWGPKLWGRVLPSKALLPLVGLGAIGVVLAGVPLLVAGFQGQPALATGGFDYELAPEALNLLSLIGHAMLALTVVGFLLAALRGFTSGELAGDDPYDGQTLEWTTPSPAPAHNFTETARVASAEPLLDLKPARSDA